MWSLRLRTQWVLVRWLRTYTMQAVGERGGGCLYAIVRGGGDILDETHPPDFGPTRITLPPVW